MSISTRHTVEQFVAGTSKAMNGQRLSKVGYKSSKNAPAKFTSVCASVPRISDDDVIARMNDLVPYVRNLLESAQDGIFRSLYESSGGTRTEIGDDEISVSACIGWLENEQNGGRLTSDGIGIWFDTNLRDNLTVLFADRIGADDVDDPRIGKHLASYRGLFCSISGGKTVLSDVQIRGIRKALEVSSVDDEMSVKLIGRLDSMEKKVKIEELLEL